MWPFKNKAVQSKDIKDLFPGINHMIKHAFTINGREFYQFDDTFNLPYERGLTCLLFYREIGMNVDDDYLSAHCNAMDNLFKPADGKIDIYKLKGLNDQLMQRLKLPKDPELVYKLASVVFFDKMENPKTYEFPYNAEKINFWKEHAGSSFFLQMPVQELIPFLKQYEENVETYVSMMQKVNQSHLESLSESLSPALRATLKTLNVLSPVATPQTSA